MEKKNNWSERERSERRGEENGKEKDMGGVQGQSSFDFRRWSTRSVKTIQINKFDKDITAEETWQLSCREEEAFLFHIIKNIDQFPIIIFVTIINIK